MSNDEWDPLLINNSHHFFFSIFQFIWTTEALSSARVEPYGMADTN